MTQSALILGATGRFGRNAAHAFRAAGWNVTLFDRAHDVLSQAVQGKDVVVNAWNPADYSKWAKELLPMHQSVIDVLRGRDTTMILAGNVYVYGDQPGIWSAQTPHVPANDLARLRVEMEAAYRDAGIRTILLRGGDFLDTQASGNWFDMIMVTRLAKGRFTYPGRPDMDHAWAYLPDFARAAVALAEKRADLPEYVDIPFPGYTLTGTQMAETLSQITGHPIKLKPMSWWPLHLVAPFVPMVRGLLPMRYLWDTPHALDAQAFHTILPGFTHTKPQEALRRAIAHV